MNPALNLSIFSVLFLLVLSSCSPKTSPSGMVSENPPSIEEGYFWIGPSKSGSITNEAGVMVYEDCFVINNSDNLQENDMVGLQFEPKNINDLELLCKPIIGFDHEEGYLHKVKGTKSYLGNELVGITVDKVVRKELDPFFEKEEQIVIYIGPKKVKSTAWTGQEIECYQAQYTAYRADKKWEHYCGLLSGFDYEPGYIYTLKINRKHVSEFEKKTVMDGPSYNDHLLSILKKQRI